MSNHKIIKAINSYNPGKELDFFIYKILKLYPIFYKRGATIYFRRGMISSDPVYFYHYDNNSLLIRTEDSHTMIGTSLILNHSLRNGTLNLAADVPTLSDEWCVDLFSMNIEISTISPMGVKEYDKTAIIRRWNINNITNG